MTETAQYAVIAEEVSRSQDQLEQAIRDVLARQDNCNWEIGDLSLEALPMGSNAEQAGGTYHQLLKLHAERVGMELDKLKDTRMVAAAWPEERRVRSRMDHSTGRLLKTTWSAHRVAMNADVQHLLMPGDTVQAIREKIAEFRRPNPAALEPVVKGDSSETLFESDVEDEQKDWEAGDPDPEANDPEMGLEFPEESMRPLPKEQRLLLAQVVGLQKTMHPTAQQFAQLKQQYSNNPAMQEFVLRGIDAVIERFTALRSSEDY